MSSKFQGFIFLRRLPLIETFSYIKKRISNNNKNLFFYSQPRCHSESLPSTFMLNSSKIWYNYFFLKSVFCHELCFFNLSSNLGETKFISWSTDPTDPVISKKQNNITKFWPTGFFLDFIIDYFLLSAFCKKKKRNKMLQTFINNQNQETFIVITINYKLQVFSSVLTLQNINFKKMLTLKIKWYFHFADRPTLFFVLSCP